MEVENEVEPPGLSGCDKRGEDFFKGRVSKESGREDVKREDDSVDSGECSVAFRLPPKTVLEVPEATDFSTIIDFPDLIGVPTLGNEHFFLL